MRALPDVTLCCVDTVNHALALRALERSRSGLGFARTVLLTHAAPAGLRIPDGIEIVDIGPLDSRAGYSEFMLKGLLPHIRTSHALVVQWDGFVVNPLAWDDAFLGCDYLGAKWFWYDSMRVGNGGFSLRSRRLLEALQDPRVQLVEVEDQTSINRATLHLAPLVVVFMLRALEAFARRWTPAPSQDVQAVETASDAAPPDGVMPAAT